MFFDPVFFLMILSDILCIAQPICYEENPNRPPPAPADCAYAIALIPSLADERAQTPRKLLSSSSPFLPDATIRHRSCVLVLRAFSMEMSDEYARRRDVLATHESTLFQSWHELKRVAEDIRTQCVEYGRGGYAGEPFRDTQDGRLYVSIRGSRDEEQSFLCFAIARRRRLMEKGHMYHQNVGNMNWSTSQDVEESWGTNQYQRAVYDV